MSLDIVSSTESADEFHRQDGLFLAEVLVVGIIYFVIVLVLLSLGAIPKVKDSSDEEGHDQQSKA